MTSGDSSLRTCSRWTGSPGRSPAPSSISDHSPPTSIRRSATIDSDDATATVEPAEPPPVADKRRAALIATAVTIPLIIILALLFSALGGASPDSGNQSGPLPAIDASAPPNVAAEAKPCAAVLDALPIQLNGLAPRRVNTTTPYVVAWGDPAIVVKCGVDKPAGFTSGSDVQLFSAAGAEGAFYFVGSEGDAEVYTAVDRQAYVSFTVPGKYPGDSVLPTLNKAVIAAMPHAVCATDPNEPDPDKLCSRRTG